MKRSNVYYVNSDTCKEITFYRIDDWTKAYILVNQTIKIRLLSRHCHRKYWRVRISGGKENDILFYKPKKPYSFLAWMEEHSLQYLIRDITIGKM